MERTLLFVPGDRPERFDKAVASGADLVVIDLEDAVAPHDKAAARAHAVAWLEAASVPVERVAVRINALGEPEHDADTQALAGHAGAILVPKAESLSALRDLHDRLDPGVSLLLLLETAAGILDARELATVPGVTRLVLGSYDLAAQLGVSPEDRDALLAARHALVLASAAAGLAGPIDGVTGDVADESGLRDDIAYAVRLGFAGKLCVHPRQVAPAAETLRPTPQDVAWASRIIGVVESAGAGAVVLVDGRMVDKPVVDRARRILEG